jgi:hypothetical protein
LADAQPARERCDAWSADGGSSGCASGGSSGSDAPSLEMGLGAVAVAGDLQDLPGLELDEAELFRLADSLPLSELLDICQCAPSPEPQATAWIGAGDTGRL